MNNNNTTHLSKSTVWIEAKCSCVSLLGEWWRHQCVGWLSVSSVLTENHLCCLWHYRAAWSSVSAGGWRITLALQCVLSFLSRPFITACPFWNFYWVWSFVTENVCILHVKAALLSRHLHYEQHTHGNVLDGCRVSLDGLTSSLSQCCMTNAAWQTRCRIFFLLDDMMINACCHQWRTSLFFFPSVVSCPNGHICITAALSERSWWLTGFFATLM